jgi:hypothetical protein
VTLRPLRGFGSVEWSGSRPPDPRATQRGRPGAGERTCRRARPTDPTRQVPVHV